MAQGRQMTKEARREAGESVAAGNRGQGPKGREQREGQVGDDAERYGAIHRSVLAGLLGQIAQRQDRNTYKASGNRLVTLFPGSNLYERREKVKKGRPAENTAGGSDAKAAEKSRQPAWIVAGEIVETSQLFARTAAGINPEWVIDLGPHLCQFRYTEPHWSAKAARVLALERVLVSGLEIARRQVDYGRVSPAEATELFIRGALVAGEAKIPLRFFEENQKVRDKIETALTRVRSRRAHDLDESLYLFYADRVENVSSVHDLNRLVRSRIAQEPNFLCATEADLIGDADASFDHTMFPDKVSLGNTALPVTYAYSPGEDKDGVTVRVPLPVAEQLTTGQLQWMVPGLREEQIGVLLRALPKTVRKTLHAAGAEDSRSGGRISARPRRFSPSARGFPFAKVRRSGARRGLAAGSLPAHLQPRVEVVDRGNKTIAEGRDLEAVQAKVESRDSRSGAWDRAVAHWEKRGLTTWSFGDPPVSVVVEEVGGAPLLAYPGLEARDGAVDLRLFRKREEAEIASRAGLRRLAELVLARDLSRVWKELAGLARHIPAPGKGAAGFHDALQQMSAKLRAPDASGFFPETLQKSAYEHLLSFVLRIEPILPLTELRFLQMARSDSPGAARAELSAWRVDEADPRAASNAGHRHEALSRNGAGPSATGLPGFPRADAA